MLRVSSLFLKKLIINFKIKAQRAKRESTRHPYDDSYDAFMARHFSDAAGKHLDKYQEYKDTHEETDYEGGGDDERSSSGEKSSQRSSKNKKKGNDDDDTYGIDHDWYHQEKDDYERIKALSQKQVHELQKNPGNCKHVERDGMICSTCEDPVTGDSSESCEYASKPYDRKLAYLTKKSHNQKKVPIEIDEPVNHDHEDEEDEEKPINPPPRGPKPSKSIHNESDDADYGGYKLANTNDDVDDYESESKFARLKAEPKKPVVKQQQQQLQRKPIHTQNSNQNQNHDFEIIPTSEFKSKNLNQAMTDFKTKDWSKCEKIIKGDMTCYSCRDKKGVKQEECMFIQESNPKGVAVQHRETGSYDENSRRKKPQRTQVSPTTTTSPLPRTTKGLEAIKREKFARLRMGRPLMPTKLPAKATAEPLVTPNPLDYDHVNADNKKAIKRTVEVTRKIKRNPSDLDSGEFYNDFNIHSDDDYHSSDHSDHFDEPRSTSFVSFVEHDEPDHSFER